ncbi:MAG TPA: CNNM domain-containing protein [Steroidobacteraceae bacterium]|nr:CNNM domain-containing protein [Steroidobacteraceae bacterium]HNS27264.1 CNNM domain-containing protein [Steroidobacteraceae bacterium]
MDTAPTTVLVIALVALLATIAFSSGTEVAMLAVNRYRVRHRAAGGHRTARVLDSLLARPDDWLGANLVILALASVAASSIATLLAQRYGGEWAVPVTIIALSIVMIVFCELAPKIYAARHPEPVALGSTYIYRALVWVAKPLLWITNQLAYGFLRLFGVRRANRGGQTLSADELRTVVAETGTVIPQGHRRMLLSILDLGQITVNDIMIPRQDIAGIDLDDDWDDILAQIRQTPHTRLPVYRGTLDDVVGLLHMKRVAQELARGTLTRGRLEELARGREPYYVPEGTPLTVQLTHFQRNRRRMGFVVDEYGDIEGLVTLEDLLEEIVGEFTNDTSTVVHKDVTAESPGVFLVNAAATIRALNRALGWTLPTDGPKTLNGLLLERFETIPDAGAALRLDGLQFEVLQVQDNAIRTVRVRTPQ